MALRDLVSRNIKALRIEAGMTQQELAEKAGLKVQYVSRLESEPQNVTLDILERLAVGCRSNTDMKS